MFNREKIIRRDIKAMYIYDEEMTTERLSSIFNLEVKEINEIIYGLEKIKN